MTNKNQVESFKIVLESLGERQADVLEAIESSEFTLTARQIAEVIGREVHQTSPRIRELMDMGLVREAGSTKCQFTGRMVTMYGETSEQERRDFTPKTKVSHIRMEMGVSLNPRTQMWVVYFRGEIVANVERFGDAEVILKDLYLSEIGE